MIDMNKKYVYSDDNRPARILCIDGPNQEAPVIAIDRWGAITHHDKDGLGAISKFSSLIEVKEKKVIWLNIYDAGVSDCWITKVYADRNGKGRIARIKVEYYEGQFDE